MLLGTSTKLEHLGRVAEALLVGDNHLRQYDLSAGRAEMQMCPGGCEIAFERRVHRPPMAPGMKDKVSRAGFKRSWKFGKAGDIALGKATGKLAPVLANPAAHKLSMMDLYQDSDTRGLDRWPAPAAP